MLELHKRTHNIIDNNGKHSWVKNSSSKELSFSHAVSIGHILIATGNVNFNMCGSLHGVALNWKHSTLSTKCPETGDKTKENLTLKG